MNPKPASFPKGAHHFEFHPPPGICTDSTWSVHLSGCPGTWPLMALGLSVFNKQQSVLHFEHKPEKSHFEWVSPRESAVATMRQ
jgi:hypothetical protein